MTARIVSAGVAAAMMLGIAAGAWAQSGGRPSQRPTRPEAEAPPSGPSQAVPDRTDGAAEAPFGSGAEAASKDPFDEAAAGEKSGGRKGAQSPGASGPGLEKATFGAGCFWHVEADFEWLPGVKSAISGYAGGHVPHPSYEMVHEGDTGHIEVVQVEYDPSVISYEQLLKVFWHGHDPTQWNRQGPDVGTQYRSAIFYHSEAQRRAALKSYRELTASRAYPAPIVTLLLPMRAFYRAEEYHQNYYGGKPDRPVAQGARSRRRARATRRATAAARPSGARKEAAGSRSSEAGRTGRDPAAGPGPAATGGRDAEP